MLSGAIHLGGAETGAKESHRGRDLMECNALSGGWQNSMHRHQRRMSSRQLSPSRRRALRTRGISLYVPLKEVLVVPQQAVAGTV